MNVGFYLINKESSREYYFEFQLYFGKLVLEVLLK